MAAIGRPLYIPALASSGTVAGTYLFNSWVPSSAGVATATRRAVYTDPECLVPASNPATLGASVRKVYMKPTEAYAFTITGAAGTPTYDELYHPDSDAAGVDALDIENAVSVVATLALLQAIDPDEIADGQTVFVTERTDGQGGGGEFERVTGDQSALVVASTKTVSSVNTATDALTVSSHGFVDGDAVVATAADAGLSLQTKYYVNSIDANTISLHTTVANAVADSSRVNITTLSGALSLKKLADPEQGVLAIATGDSLLGTDGIWRRVKRDRIESSAWAPRTGDATPGLYSICNYVKAQTYKPVVTYVGGLYSITSCPNHGIEHARFLFEGEARFVCSGTTPAFVADGGAGAVDVTIGTPGNPVIVAGAAGSASVAYISFLNRSSVSVHVVGGATAGSGILINGCVSTEFWPKAAHHINLTPGAWYGGHQPQIGITVQGNCSYCNFYNPCAEGVSGNGILGAASGGVSIYGGTAEGCGARGLTLTTGSFGWKIFNLDMEVNTVGDALLEGEGHELISCDSEDVIEFGAAAQRCMVRGGQHKDITITAGALGCSVEHTTYNRNGDGGAFTDSGTDTYINGLRNGKYEYVEPDNYRFSTYEVDFFGDTIPAELNAALGTDAQCAVAMTGSVDGVVSIASGNDAAADAATNMAMVNGGALNWQPSNGALDIDFLCFIDDITTTWAYWGFTDVVSSTGTIEAPFTYSGTTLTSNATDAVGFLFDTEATTDNIKLVGVANNVDAAVQDSGVAPVNNTYFHGRISISTAGVARFFINGAQVGSAMTGACTANVPLTFVFATFSRAAAQRVMALKYLRVRMKRTLPS